MAKLSEEKVAEIRRVYSELHTYSATAKVVGCSPASVKKYCQDGCSSFSLEKTKEIPFSGYVPSVEEIKWPKLKEKMAVYSKKEYEEIKELWKEILV